MARCARHAGGRRSGDRRNGLRRRQQVVVIDDRRQAGSKCEVGRHAHAAVEWGRRRRAGSGLLVLPVRLRAGQRPAPLAVHVQAHGYNDALAGSRRWAGTDIRRREDRDREDQDRREVQPAGEPRGDLGGREVRDGARLLAAGGKRLRDRLLGRHHGLEGLRGRQGQGDHRDPDPGRADARDPSRPADGRDRDRRHGAARHGSRAGGVRGEVRRGQEVDLRAARGLHRPVHDPERQQRQDHGLPAREVDHAGAQPELGQVDGLPPRLPRQDRGERGQRHHRREPEDPAGPEHGRQPGRPAGAAGDPQGGDDQLQVAVHRGPVHRALPLHRPEHEGEAVRQHQRAQGGHRGDGQERAASRVGWAAGRRHPDALPVTEHRRLQPGRRHERPQPRLHAHAERRHGAGRVVHEEGGLPEREVHRRRARSRWSPTAPRRRRRWPRRR